MLHLRTRARFTPHFTFLVASTLSMASLTSPVRGQTIATVYSNATNFNGQAYAPGGTSGTTTLTTPTIADDIQLASGADGTIDSFTFSVANFNATDTTARVILSFYNMDPTTGNPTTLLADYIFTPTTFTAGRIATLSYSSSDNTPLFTTNGSFWAGETFDNGGTASATTAAELDNLGVALLDPPTIGTSEDAFFQSDNAGPSVYGASNPAGGIYYFGPAPNPIANFFFVFTGGVAGSALPEPSDLALMASGVVCVTSLALRRRGKTPKCTAEN